MRYRFFTIPVQDCADAELNRFIGGHRVVSVDRQFVADGTSSFWAVCVGVLPPMGPGSSAKKSRVDYREVLSDGDFAVFAKLRVLRKAVAEEEGVPAYAVFTNEQLAAMVQTAATTKTALRAIPGVGEARAAKYGGRFLPLLRETIQAADAVPAEAAVEV